MNLTMKAARVNANLTQAKAAELLGMTQQTLSKYENGNSFPNIVTIKKMGTTYNVDFRDLIFFNRESN